MQLEEKQLKRPEPITNQTIDNITNPLNKLKCKELIKEPNQNEWKRGMCNELGSLLQGWKRLVGRNTIFFTHKSNMPKNKTATYGRICCDARPQKTEVRRVQLTAGGNLIKYDVNTSTPTAGITTIKTYWNSVISTPKARHATMGIKDFYLNSALKEYSHMRLPETAMPEEFIAEHNLELLIVDGCVHMEI